jgi:integrase
VKVASPVWYAYWCLNGKKARVPLYRDKKASEELMLRLYRDAQRAAGLQYAARRGPVVRVLDMPLLEYLGEYIAVLKAKNRCPAYICVVNNAIRDVAQATNARYVTDLDADKILIYLHEKRQKGRFSVTTSNMYIKYLRSFAYWLYDSKRTQENVLGRLKLLENRSTKTRLRRALTLTELEALLLAAWCSEDVLFGLTGVDRQALYATAFGTGFRARELLSLRVGSFNLDRARVHLDAAHAKNRQDVDQPIPAELVNYMHTYLHGKDPEALIWPDRSIQTAVLIKHDLTAAHVAYCIDGKYADFHALRHTYITHMGKNAAPRVTQLLARHADIKLTLGVYTDSRENEMREAVAAMQMPTIKAPGCRIHGALHAIGEESV